MLTFYHSPETRSIRTLWLLEELGQPYDLRYVTIANGGPNPSERDPSNPHPDGKVPAIVHDGVAVSESYAIALYLTDLLPQAQLGADIGTRERGTYLEWLAWSLGELEPVLVAHLFGGADNPMMQRRFAETMQRIETALANGPYLMGDRFTAIDVMVGGTLIWARSVLPESAAIDSYLERITERPASAAAFARDARPAVAA